MQATIQSAAMIVDSVSQWKETREVETVVKPEIKRIDVQEELDREKIQAMIEELEKQTRR